MNVCNKICREILIWKGIEHPHSLDTKRKNKFVKGVEGIIDKYYDTKLEDVVGNQSGEGWLTSNEKLLLSGKEYMNVCNKICREILIWKGIEHPHSLDTKRKNKFVKGVEGIIDKYYDTKLEDVVGNQSGEGWLTSNEKLLLLEYLQYKLKAERMMGKERADKKQGSAEAVRNVTRRKYKSDIAAILKKDLNDSWVVLLNELHKLMVEKVQKDGLKWAKPIVDFESLTAEQKTTLEDLNGALREDYSARKALLQTRVEVIAQSFNEKEETKADFKAFMRSSTAEALKVKSDITVDMIKYTTHASFAYALKAGMKSQSEKGKAL
eukprot:CAMPEP_0113915524 /NCGR_PEP_ID=MMETSP0780_2-20120614/31316_1 /TAXON_ID=652834 /ORGANISM="Palpitomonas bilix" /LENGTH=322 /DNA_ID=CAMNT_0000914175 /DNA_START=9 /DNA_END=974 /DNA_ORIENTATION=+ /assembly_acc=CAM_ASM_000599